MGFSAIFQATQTQLSDYKILTYSQSQQIGRQFGQLIKKHKLSSLPRDTYCDETMVAGTIIQEANVGKTPSSVALIVDVRSLKDYPDLVRIPVSDVAPDFRTVYMVYNTLTFKTHAVEQFITFIRENHSLL